MIYIEEIRPKKLSGLTSFFVKFPYNEKLIGEIKLLAPAVYHKKDYAWEIAANYLSKLLDTCVKYDDVSLTMLTRLSQTSRIAIKSESSIVGSPGSNSGDTECLNEPEKRDTDLTEAEIRAFKIKPFKHQIEAINFGLSKDHKKWLLLDGCGLGKSAEMVWTAETLHRRGLVDHCLFICGVNSLKQNIAGEIKKFGNENYVILGEKKAKSGKISYGTVADRVKQLREPIDAFWVITNVETIRDDKFVEAFKKSKNKFDMICYDEIHRCLTHDTILDTNLGPFTIGEIVDNAICCDVKSLNLSTNTIEYTPVLCELKNLNSEPVLELVIDSDGMQYTLKCTESHKVYTKNRGYVKAKDLTVYDDIVVC